MRLLKSLWIELSRRGESAGDHSIQAQLRELADTLRHGDPAVRQAITESLRTILATHPNEADAHALLGDALLADQRPSEAEACYRAALALQPEQARAQEGLGLVLLGSGQLDQAYLHLGTAHRLAPMNAEVMVHWGLVDLGLGNLAEAGSKFKRAIERDARNANAWQNLGLVSYKLGKFDDCVNQLRTAVQINPSHGLAYSNLALALRQLNDLSGALDAALRATVLKPTNARVWVVLGDLYCDQGDFDQSSLAHSKALEIAPNSVGAQIGMGKLHQATGSYDQSRQAFEAALTVEPSNADALGGLAQLQLLLGQWETGWDLYEARRHTFPSPVRPVPGPEWSGESLVGRRLLIHAEQGLGDIILFGSCVQDLIDRGAKCLVDVPPRLEKLFRRSFPTADVFGHDLQLSNAEWLAQLPPFDLHIPIGSLPRWTRRNNTAFPQRRNFLIADTAKVDLWKSRLSTLPRPLIGLSWRGGLLSTAGRQRSLELMDMLEAFEGANASFICVQYGNTTSELLAANATSQRIHPGLSDYSDLDDLAALTAALDGVITICSTQAHLSGALGVAGAVLVPSNPSWRYGASDSLMPWYPSLTLLRQTETRMWAETLGAARQWLDALIK